MEVWRASAEGLKHGNCKSWFNHRFWQLEESSGTLFMEFEKNDYTFSGGTSYVDVRDVARFPLN